MNRLKGIKRFLAKIFAVTLGLVMVSPMVSLKANAEEKTIDMYLVAGQSNAAGCTLISNIPQEKIKDEYRNGFSNVLYYGKVTGSNDILNFTTNVKLGQGQTSGCIGPEIGIADAIQRYSPDRQAIVVKRAYGGTQLIDTALSQNSESGNWASPSMRNSSSLQGKTGKLYDEYIQVVTDAVNHYKNQGYTVNLKGTFWMQGESDVGVGAETYRPYLEALIDDLRVDYAKLFGEDEGRSAPFVIGKIATTMDGGASKWPQLTPFIQMQQEVANSKPSVYCVETKDYIITDTATGLPAEGCHDTWHFSGKDMLSLGYEAGKIMFERDGSDMLVVNVQGEGQSSTDFENLDGNPVEVTFTPEKYHYLSKVTLDGVDVTSEVENGKYVFNGTTGVHYLTAEFEKYGQYELEIETDSTKGKLSRDPVLEKYYPGMQIKITPKPTKGYKIKSLKFNGEELELKGTFYRIEIVAGENKLEAEWEKIETQAPTGGSGTNTTPPEDESNGIENLLSSCSSGIGSIIPITLLTGFIALKKKNARK